MLSTADNGFTLSEYGYRIDVEGGFATYRLNADGTFSAYGYSGGQKRTLGKPLKTAAEARAKIALWKPRRAQAIKREIAVLNGKPVDVCRRRGDVPYSAVYTNKQGLPKPSP
ncbi:hypothetical protein N9N82_03075 [Luminiphilus sp.]|nr:hypothetical protein [Luminiphilus sp.]